MRIWLLLIIFFFFSGGVFASECKILLLNNLSFDQALSINAEVSQEDSGKCEVLIPNNNVDEESKTIVEGSDGEAIVEGSDGEAIVEGSDGEAKIILKELDQLIDYSSKNLSDVNEVILLPDLWEKTNEENLNFLLDNITDIRSSALRYELLSMLNIDNLPPKNLDKVDFENLVIRNLLKFGDRNKAYQIINRLSNLESNKYSLFYKEIVLNYLLSTHDLREACDFRNNLKNTDVIGENNYFLKVEIFCLILEEKFDEASLLKTLLQETGNTNNEYFQYLYDKLNHPNIENADLTSFEINEKEIFLYSAMHREGNIALSQKFLKLDPANLSMPIIFSGSTDIELRLKAAHVAYNHGIINTDSLAALYQIVDFSSKELNDPSSIELITSGNIEMGMAYYYQLSKVQLLPITRLEAILSFWEFAEKNNLESIAYSLSQKGLDTIEPSNELSEYGPDVVKAYVRSGNFEKAEKWLLFSEKFSGDFMDLHKLESAKLLLNLFKADESSQFIDILLKNLQNMYKNSINNNDQTSILNNEILFVIFSLLNNEDQNPFSLSRKVDDQRFMPSSYIMNSIRECINDNNHAELLLSTLVSIDGKEWDELHPEHIRLIIIALQDYKNGFLLNDIIMEILEQNKII